MTDRETDTEDDTMDDPMGGLPRQAGDAVNTLLMGTGVAYVLVMFVPGTGMLLGSNMDDRTEVARALREAQHQVEAHEPDRELHVNQRGRQHDA